MSPREGVSRQTSHGIPSDQVLGAKIPAAYPLRETDHSRSAEVSRSTPPISLLSSRECNTEACGDDGFSNVQSLLDETTASRRARGSAKTAGPV